MPDYDNTNRGVLFPNGKKETENHPDHKGNLNVEGKEYWFSAWNKTSAKGEPYMSVSIQEKKPLEKKDWVKPELRQKFQDVEERGDDSAKHEVVLDDDFDPEDPVDMSQIPF